MYSRLAQRLVRAAAVWGAAAGSILLAQPQPVFALATPTLTTQASSPSLVGGSMTDTATLAGGVSPTGTITFQLNSGCGGSAAIFTSTVTVNGNGSYTSGSFSPLAAATYTWVASYSGDANNNPVTTVCGDGAETEVVPEHCPPQSCPPPTTQCNGGGGGTNTVITTTSTTSCMGSSPQVTVTTAFFVGPATVCYGPGKSLSCTLPPGGIDFNTNTETVTVSAVAVPTLSIWGLGALLAGLGALALRRLKLPRGDGASGAG